MGIAPPAPQGNRPLPPAPSQGYIDLIAGPETPDLTCRAAGQGRRPGRIRAPWSNVSPKIRKITYAVSFETLAILMGASVLKLFSGAPAEATLGLSVTGAVIALGWSYLYNSLFEAWEARQATKGRSLLRRAIHATLFELGMTALLLPVTAWFLSVGLWTAFVYELGLILFYLGFAWVFTWAFDKVFGLPDSAR